jgi:hypothetical protein
MRLHPPAPANVARISVATSGTDFTAREADFAALIRAASVFRITFVTWELQELGQRLVRSRAQSGLSCSGTIGDRILVSSARTTSSRRL